MKPSYSIIELAEILGQDVYTVANGLVADEVPTFHNGRIVDLADYDCFRPSYNGEHIFVHTGGPPSPNQYTIFVSTAVLPTLWKECIEKAQLLNDEFLPKVASKSSAEKPLAESERNKLLKQIGALSLALAEKSKRYKLGDKPNVSQIADTVIETLDALPAVNRGGIGKSSFRCSIKAGLDLLIMIKP